MRRNCPTALAASLSSRESSESTDNGYQLRALTSPLSCNCASKRTASALRICRPAAIFSSILRSEAESGGAVYASTELPVSLMT